MEDPLCADKGPIKVEFDQSLIDMDAFNEARAKDAMAKFNNIRCLFSNVVMEMKNIDEGGIDLENFKIEIAQIIVSALNCLEKLSEVNDAPELDLEQKYSIKEIKTALYNMFFKVARVPLP